MKREEGWGWRGDLLQEGKRKALTVQFDKDVRGGGARGEGGSVGDHRILK